MPALSDKSLRPIFQPDGDDAPIRALVVAGACGNVGLGKLGQFARLMAKHGIPVVALDLSDKVQDSKTALRNAYGDHFKTEVVDQILEGVRIVQGGIGDLPQDLRVGFVFEAIPERLDIKHAFYREVRARDPEAYIFSATSGYPSTVLFEGLDGADRCGVMHPFFPHLTNKLWEVPRDGACTSPETVKIMARFLGGLGMSTIAVKDVPAFAADRIFCGMMLEAVRIHDSMGLSPAQVDDVCKKTFGTSPFFVHNLIRGANYLSAHCMELMRGEEDSTLFAIPEVWKAYVEDPDKQWPYERGEKCPPQHVQAVRERFLGMLLSLTAAMVDRKVAKLDALNFLCENALAFRTGTPALVAELGTEEAQRLVTSFVKDQGITHADRVAPHQVFAADAAPWHEIYVGTAVIDGVGLLSLKRATLNHTFIDQLDAAYERLAGDDAVKAIVIAPDGTYLRETGHGADLGAFVPVLGNQEQALALIQRWKTTLTKLRGGKPTVAALVGRALGGSLELVANCHARIAGEGARLQFPETTVGVVPGLGGCHLLHRAIDAAHWPALNEALLRGVTIAADDAKAWGFVHDIVPIRELPQQSMALASRLASGETAMPAFREGAATVEVSMDISPKSASGLSLDGDLRALLASTIEAANAATVSDGAALESQRAAQSLAASAASIGVKAALRGRQPKFDQPLV